jgi:ribose transport system ATP-binding protein
LKAVGISRSRHIARALGDSAARTSVILLAAVILAALAFGITERGYLSESNIFNIAEQTAAVSLIALGMTAVIIARGIDLSVGSGTAFAAVVGMQVMQAGASAPATIAAVIGAGIALGALNGLLVAYIRVNAFMATIGTYALAAGAAIGLSNGSGVIVNDPAILWLGTATVAGVPMSAVVTLGAVGLFWVLMRRTVLGRWLYATGGNRTAAIAAGIPVKLVEFSAYLITGMMVGVGSLVTIGRVHSFQPLSGQGLEFAAITAAVIGGTSLAGGRGDIVSTFLGSVFVGVIAAGLSFAGVDQQVIYVFTGAFIVVAVLVSQREILQGLRERVLVGRLALSNRFRRVEAQAREAREASQGGRTLEVRNIQKRFPGVLALKSVTFDLHSGEVVGLVGENGAGKSTLVKVLAGDHRPNAGDVLIDGVPAQFGGPEDARHAGIAVIRQHFTLVPDLTVAENLFLGDEPRWPVFGILRRGEMERLSGELLEELEIPVAPHAQVGTLGVGSRQMIEIAKAIRERAWLVVMDEPTSALSARERDHLYAFIARLQARGTAILFISHKLDEVYHVASRAVVLRDGEVVGIPELASASPERLVNMMVGRPIESLFPYAAAEIGDERLVVEGLGDGGVLQNASLTVRSGETVGLVGLMGSGRTELIRCVMGLSPVTRGSIRVFGQTLDGQSSANMIGLGVAYIPEDRFGEGIFPQLTVAENLSLLWIREQSSLGVLPTSRERAMVADAIRELNIKPPLPRRLVSHLSGGNQQKVVLGKSLILSPQLVLADDPTRGVDVGAKAEIHSLIARLKTAGAGVLLTSSELPEVLAVADRVVVMRNGETVAEYPRGAPEVRVMHDAYGGPAGLVPAEGQSAQVEPDPQADARRESGPLS